MDTRTYELYETFSEADLETLRKFEQQRIMQLTNTQFEELKSKTPEQRREWLRKGNNRNEPCPCGSGVKFKKCCW